MNDENTLPAQIRAARGLLGWTQEDLARAAGVGLSTVKDVEAGKRDPIAANLRAIRSALEEAEIKFVPGNGDGPGVRFAKHLPQIIRRPTRTNGSGRIPFRVAYRRRKVIVFLWTEVLDDLDHTNHLSDQQFVASFSRHEEVILQKVAAAIDAGRVIDERLELGPDDFMHA